MKLFLSEEKANLGRQREIDYAKIIAIVFMVLIHVWKELSYFDCFELVPTGSWHNLLQFGGSSSGSGNSSGSSAPTRPRCSRCGGSGWA